MLTVTICDPLAAIASFMTPKSLYLPVPTMSRESNDFPPMTSLSSVISTSLRHRHDFDDVLFVQRRVGNLPGAIDVVTMHHHDHALIRVHVGEQAMQSEPRPMVPTFAVDRHATP